LTGWPVNSICHLTDDGDAQMSFNWQDPLLLDQELSADEILVRDATRAFAEERLLPRVNKAYLDEETDPEVFREFGAQGMLGVTTAQHYGGLGSNYVAYGLDRARDRARRLRLSLDAQRAVVARHVSDLRPMARRSSARNTCRRLATGEWIGCFGLTEPDAGSDPGA
jgi:glutaryl-CoA dehydrogenase